MTERHSLSLVRGWYGRLYYILMGVGTAAVGLFSGRENLDSTRSEHNKKKVDPLAEV